MHRPFLNDFLLHSNFNINQPGGFPGGAVVENLPANAGEHGLEP